MAKIPETITRTQFHNWLKGLEQEIYAGSCLVARTDSEKSWNSATARAVRMVKQYSEGNGLTQLVDKSLEVQL